MAIRMNPYLICNGNAKEAVAFYKEALDAEVVGVQTFGEAPGDPNYPMSDDVKDRVMHAMLRAGETNMMLSDTFPGQPFTVGNNVTIALVSDSVEKTNKMFAALSEGGHVGMPLQETFWSPAYGMVTDKFGVSWQVTTEVKS